jgi:hypothetical protein
MNDWLKELLSGGNFSYKLSRIDEIDGFILYFGSLEFVHILNVHTKNLEIKILSGIGESTLEHDNLQKMILIWDEISENYEYNAITINVNRHYFDQKLLQILGDNYFYAMNNVRKTVASWINPSFIDIDYMKIKGPNLIFHHCNMFASLNEAIANLHKNDVIFSYKWNVYQKKLNVYYYGYEGDISVEIFEDKFVLINEKSKFEAEDEDKLKVQFDKLMKLIWKKQRILNLYNPPKKYFNDLFQNMIRQSELKEILFEKLLTIHTAEAIEEHCARKLRLKEYDYNIFNVDHFRFFKFLDLYFIVYNKNENIESFNGLEEAEVKFKELVMENKRRELDALFIKHTTL